MGRGRRTPPCSENETEPTPLSPEPGSERPPANPPVESWGTDSFRFCAIRGPDFDLVSVTWSEDASPEFVELLTGFILNVNPQDYASAVGRRSPRVDVPSVAADVERLQGLARFMASLPRVPLAERRPAVGVGIDRRLRELAEFGDRFLKDGRCLLWYPPRESDAVQDEAVAVVAWLLLQVLETRLRGGPAPSVARCRKCGAMWFEHKEGRPPEVCKRCRPTADRRGWRTRAVRWEGQEPYILWQDHQVFLAGPGGVDDLRGQEKVEASPKGFRTLSAPRLPLHETRRVPR